MESHEGTRELNGSEIAVIGIACRFPGARNPDEYWQMLRYGLHTTSFLKDEELDPTAFDAAFQAHPNYVKAASLLEDVDMFDASFFGYSPREAEVMDPQQRLFLELAWEALEHAGYDCTTYQGAIGVYAGARTNTYIFNLFSNPEALGASGAFEVGLGNDLAFLSARVAYKLGLRGPAYSVHTACSTGLVAVHMACQSLLIDECQMALAGGIAVNVPQKTGYLYQEGSILSPDGYCRAFDARAAGTIFGSGGGIVVLKRLENAIADGDRIYAVVKGSATNNDGASKASFTAPSVEGQAAVIAEALAVSGVEPETISFIEAHGTGTHLGDPIEIHALAKAFHAFTEKKNFCAIGSVKMNFGHLDAAAGIASFIKAVLAMDKQILPPSLHFEQPNPNIDFDNSPFYVNTSPTKWDTGSSPRRAGVSSFGIGGTNAHVILEEAPPIEDSADSRPYQLLMLSAKSDNALDTAMSNLADYLKQHPEASLSQVAHTLRVGRAAFNHRAILVCRDVDEAINALEIPEPPRVYRGATQSGFQSVIFMFPGQGVQHINMGRELYESEPTFRQDIDNCAEYLQPHLGFDLRDILFPSAAQAEEASQQLNETCVTQPALFMIEYALARLWMQWGVKPRAMIGHSLGEYVAACLAGVLSLEDALRLVTVRGRMMQGMPKGDMLAIPLAEDTVLHLLNEKLSLAAVNGPAQCIVSGHTEAVAELQEQLTKQQIDSRQLLTSHAFHSSMMEPIVESFAEQVALVERKPPTIPYLSNVTGTWITEKEISDPSYWAKQLRSPVRFAQGLRELLKEENLALLEVGPGQTLSRLARQSFNQSAGTLLAATLPSKDDHQAATAFQLINLGKLWLGGASLDMSGFSEQVRRSRIALPTYPFERQRYWIEPKAIAAQGRRNQTTIDRKLDLDEWFYLPSWKRSALPRRNELSATPHSWLIFLDDCGVGVSIVKRLRQAGQYVVVVKAAASFDRTDEATFSINPTASEDYNTVLQALREQGREPDNIIHLWTVMADGTESDKAFFQTAQELGYYSLLFLTWALAKIQGGKTVQIEMVSNHLQEVNGEATCPEKATLLGPCIVVSQEYPNFICRSLDIVLPSPDSQEMADLAEYLIAELQTPSSHPIIAYRGGQRWIRHFEPLQLAQDATSVRPLRDNGVYLITGGLGGVGLILADYLARSVQPRLILTRLSAFPSKDLWTQWLQEHGDEDDISRKIRRLQAIEDVGAEVMVASVDAADEAQMQALLALIYEQFGELNGVLHAAGVTSGSSVYRAVTEVGVAESEAQFTPKVYGVYVLEKVLQGKELDFCLLFSSNAAVLGGLGFVAYSAANLFMDAFACSRNQSGSPVWLAANWDHWPEETRQIIGPRTSIDQYTMTHEESEEAFRRLVSSGSAGQVIVSTGDLPSRLRLWVSRDTNRNLRETVEGSASAAHPRPRLETDFIAPRNEYEQTVADVWQQVLGVKQIGIYDNFFDLGGHSLLVTQVIGRLRDAFKVDLPLSKLFDVPTVAGLAEIITNIKTEADDQERMEILNMLSRLSEEEAEVEIAKRANVLEEL
jgi:acyl transferase domain-containing protein